MEITKFCCYSFVKIIPWNQLFTKELYSRLIWREKICVAVNFSFFHTVALHTVWNIENLLFLTLNFFVKLKNFLNLSNRIVGFIIWLSFLHSTYHPNLLVSLTNKFAAFWCNLLLWKGFAPPVFCWLYYSLLPKEDLKVWWWRCQVSINFEWIISSKSSFFFFTLRGSPFLSLGSLITFSTVCKGFWSYTHREIMPWIIHGRCSRNVCASK